MMGELSFSCHVPIHPCVKKNQTTTILVPIRNGHDDNFDSLMKVVLGHTWQSIGDSNHKKVMNPCFR